MCLLASTLASISWGQMVGLGIAGGVVWMAPYTVAVLGLRACYRRLRGKWLGIERGIGFVIVFGALAAPLVALAVVATVLPFFWDELAAQFARAGMPLVARDFFIRMVVEQALRSHLFIAAWGFIYIGVVTQRRVRQARLQALELGTALKQAQLSSLSNQLNPHFLFNSLNNIRFMLHEDAGHADKVIGSLQEILL